MKILVRYENSSLADIRDLVERHGGYFDADKKCVVFQFELELAEELENRGIKYTTHP